MEADVREFLISQGETSFIFTNAKGHQKSTDRHEWQQITYTGVKVWAFRGKKTTYITPKKIR